MSEYITEDEQVERIKKWWSDNGSSVIAGLVIGIAGLLGWRFWSDYQANYSAEASLHFGAVEMAMKQDDPDKAIEEAELILKEYSSSGYAAFAHLSLARAYVMQQQYDQAATTLQALLDAKPDKATELLARKRLARLLIQQNKLDQALEVVSIDYATDYAAAFEEIKGDLHAARGDIELARMAYQKARLAQPGPEDVNYLQQKLDDLGEPESESDQSAATVSNETTALNG